MKKTLLTLTLAALALTGFAGETKTYTDLLSVTVDGVGTKQEATITVEYLDETHINFTLNNFVLRNVDEESGEVNDMPVGNIALENLTLTPDGQAMTFTFHDNLLIQNGDAELSDYWVGPMLGEVPLVLDGAMTSDKLYVSIDIDLQSLGQIIKVVFGDKVDAIAAVKSAAPATQVVYDLAGRRVSPSAHGLYIVDGKKVVR